MSSLVSIIIPVYKSETFLPKCIESCCKQTYKNIEIILVNDGSPDNSPAICTNYASSDPRIKVINKDNTGVSDTRNTGIRNARGTFITFVDSDDWIMPETIEKLVSLQNKHNLDLVTGGMKIHRNGILSSTQLPTNELISETNNIAQHLTDDNKLKFYRTPCCKLYKRELINKYHLLFDTSLKINEDFVFVLSYLSICKTIGTCAYGFYNYNHIFTSQKMRHYELHDLQKQWSLNLFQFEVYKNYFIETDTYSSNKNMIYAYLINRIRSFVSTAILARSNSQDIKMFLKQIPNLKDYPPLCNIKYRHAAGFMSKIALFCIRNKAWNLFYICFYWKNTLYSHHIYKYKED